YLSVLTTLESMKLVVGKAKAVPYTLFPIKHQPPQYSYDSLSIEELDYIFICMENAEKSILHDRLKQNTLVLNQSTLVLIYPVVLAYSNQYKKFIMILNIF